MYIAETAPANVRGSLTTVYQLMITFGIFIANIVNTIINKTINHNSDTIWRVALAAQVIPAGEFFYRKFFYSCLTDFFFICY
jgi:hypothetical protein